MKNLFSSAFSWSFLKTAFLRFFLILIFLGAFVATSLAYVPYAGSLYSKWMSQIFVELPDGENAFTQPLSNPTVQRSHALSDINGDESAWATEGTNGQKQLLIGENVKSSDTVKVAGENAGVRVQALSGNPEISLGETDGNHGSLYFDTTSGEMRVWTGKKENGALVGQNAFSLSDSGVNFPEKLTANGVPLVSVFSCAEGAGLLQGFDENAQPICSVSDSSTIWVAVPTSYTCTNGKISYSVSCRSGADFSVVEENSVCENLDLVKPAAERDCSVG